MGASDISAARAQTAAASADESSAAGTAETDTSVGMLQLLLANLTEEQRATAEREAAVSDQLTFLEQQNALLAQQIGDARTRAESAEGQMGALTSMNEQLRRKVDEMASKDSSKTKKQTKGKKANETSEEAAAAEAQAAADPFNHLIMQLNDARRENFTLAERVKTLEDEVAAANEPRPATVVVQRGIDVTHSSAPSTSSNTTASAAATGAPVLVAEAEEAARRSAEAATSQSPERSNVAVLEKQLADARQRAETAEGELAALRSLTEKIAEEKKQLSVRHADLLLEVESLTQLLADSRQTNRDLVGKLAAATAAAKEAAAPASLDQSGTVDLLQLRLERALDDNRVLETLMRKERDDRRVEKLQLESQLQEGARQNVEHNKKHQELVAQYRKLHEEIIGLREAELRRQRESSRSTVESERGRSSIRELEQDLLDNINTLKQQNEDLVNVIQTPEFKFQLHKELEQVRMLNLRLSRQLRALGQQVPQMDALPETSDKSTSANLLTGAAGGLDAMSAEQLATLQRKAEEDAQCIVELTAQKRAAEKKVKSLEEQIFMADQAAAAARDRDEAVEQDVLKLRVWRRQAANIESVQAELDRVKKELVAATSVDHAAVVKSITMQRDEQMAVGRSLASELAHERVATERLRQDHAVLTSRMEALQAEQSAMFVPRHELAAQVQVTKDVQAALLHEQEVSGKLQGALDHAEQLIQSLTARLAAESVDPAKAADERRQFERRVALLQEQNRTLERRAASTEEELETISKELVAAEKDIRQKEQEASILRIEKRKCELQLQEATETYRTSRAQVEQELATTKSELTAAASKVSQQQRSLAESTASISPDTTAVTNMIQMLKNENATMVKEKEALAAEIAMLRDELSTQTPKSTRASGRATPKSATTHHARILDLEAEVTSLQSQLAASRSRLEGSEKRCSQLEAELGCTKKESAALEDDNKSLRASLRDTKNAIKSAEHANAALAERNEELNIEIKQLENSVARLQATPPPAPPPAAPLPDFSDERKALNTRIDSLRAELLAAGELLSQERESNRSLQSSLIDSKQQVEASHHQLTRGKAQSDEAVASMRQVLKEERSVQATLNEQWRIKFQATQDQLAERVSAVADLEAKLALALSKEAKLSVEVESLKQAQARMAADITSTSSSSSIARRSANLSSLQSPIVLEGESDAWTELEELETIRRCSAIYESGMIACRSLLQMSSTTTGALRQRIAELEAKVATTGADLNAAFAQLREKDLRIEKMSAAATQRDSRISELEKETRRLQKELFVVQDGAATQLASLDDLRGSYTALEKALSEEKRRAASALAESTRARDAAAEMKNEADSSKANAALLERRIPQLNQRIEELQKQLVVSKDEYTTLVRQASARRLNPQQGASAVSTPKSTTSRHMDSIDADLLATYEERIHDLEKQLAEATRSGSLASSMVGAAQDAQPSSTRPSAALEANNSSSSAPPTDVAQLQALIRTRTTQLRELDARCRALQEGLTKLKKKEECATFQLQKMTKLFMDQRKSFHDQSILLARVQQRQMQQRLFDGAASAAEDLFVVADDAAAEKSNPPSSR